MITVLLILSSFLLSPGCDNMPEVRFKYNNIKTEEDLNLFMEFTESVSCEKAIPYKASAEMQKAQFALTPWKKIGHFKKGKKALEKYIKQYPKDVEARYIRFLVQSNAPFFLGYRSEIKNDYDMIQNNIKDCEMPEEYKKQMLTQLNQFYKK